MKGPDGCDCSPAYTIAIGGVQGSVTATAICMPGSEAVWQTTGLLQGVNVTKKKVGINGLIMKCKVVVDDHIISKM